MELNEILTMLNALREEVSKPNNTMCSSSEVDGYKRALSTVEQLLVTHWITPEERDVLVNAEDNEHNFGVDY